jgi:hypothetical protein
LAVLLAILSLGTSRVDAGSMTPYQAVLLDFGEFGGGDETLVIVDMATGGHTDVAVPVDSTLNVSQATLAVDSEGACYVYYGFFGTELGQGSLMARLDPTLSEWTTTAFDGNIDFPGDTEFKPDGTLITSAEFGLFDIDLVSRTIEWSGVPRGDLSGIEDPATQGVEVDASGTITTGYWTGDWPQTSILFRQGPEDEFAERFDTEVGLVDFVLQPDGSLIGLGWDEQQAPLYTDTVLYRLDFDTKTVDELFRSELLDGAIEIELAPDGRVVVLTYLSDSLQRVMRVDLELQTTEVIAEIQGRGLGDVELRIIPEPSCVVLLLLGIAGLVASRPRRHHARG